MSIPACNMNKGSTSIVQYHIIKTQMFMKMKKMAMAKKPRFKSPVFKER